MAAEAPVAAEAKGKAMAAAWEKDTIAKDAAVAAAAEEALMAALEKGKAMAAAREKEMGKGERVVKDAVVAAAEVRRAVVAGEGKALAMEPV